MADFELTTAAADDLADIYHYTYIEHGEGQAERYVSQIKERLPILASNPMLGHAIIYRKGKTGIVVVRVIHGARNIERLIAAETE